MKRNHKKFSAWVALILTIMLSAAMNVDAQQITIRFPVEYHSDITPAYANKEFGKLIAERSNGRIKMKFYPHGSLYKGQDLLQAVLRGDAEMTTLVSVYWAAVSPRITILELPYALPTHEAFYNVSDDQEFIDELYSEVEKKGAKVLSLIPYDYLPLGVREAPVIHLSDFKGKKLRALGRTNAKTLDAWGATTVPINITEVQGALQQGLIDGLNTPLDAFMAYKFHEWTKHITYAKYFFGYYPWTVNAKWWKSLSRADQKLIHDTVREVSVRHRPRAKKAADDAIEELKKLNVRFHYQTAAEQKEWKAATQKLWTEAERTFGAAITARLKTLTEKP